MKALKVNLHFSATTSDKIFDVFNTILMILIAIITLYPFWYCIVLSLNEGIDNEKSIIFISESFYTGKL